MNVWVGSVCGRVSVCLLADLAAPIPSRCPCPCAVHAYICMRACVQLCMCMRVCPERSVPHHAPCGLFATLGHGPWDTYPFPKPCIFSKQLTLHLFAEFLFKRDAPARIHGRRPFVVGPRGCRPRQLLLGSRPSKGRRQDVGRNDENDNDG